MGSVIYGRERSWKGKSMKLPLLLTLVIVISSCVQSQDRQTAKLIGRPCEGCEAVFEYGNKKLFPIDTLPGFIESKYKIKVTGIIYEQDGKTPAKDVVLYIYHTNESGIYKASSSETGWGKRHGSLRGWIVTDIDGRYTFYTLKPGAYPGRTFAAHIHPVILESDGKYYYIEDYYFEGDEFLTEKEKSPSNPRGGISGVLSLKKEGDMWVGERDIILGKNILNYE